MAGDMILDPSEEKKKKRMMKNLPLEMTAIILSRLPVDSIVECKLVCKTWRTLIEDDIGFLSAYNTSSTAVHCQSSNSAAEAEAQPFGFFTLLENQLRYGECYKKEKEEEEEEAHFFKLTKPLNYPPLPRHPEEKKLSNAKWAILGSSNGLICLSACRFNVVVERKIFTYNIYVNNPMTREFVDVGTETHDDGGFRASGFGYHPSTNKYKVVRINYKTYPPPSGHVSVYTLGSGGASGWRDKGEIPYEIMGVSKPGVLVNGALYWITLDKKILSFDLEDEKFRIVVSKPSEINPDYDTGLGVLRGCLSAGISYGGECTDVWIMNNNNNRTIDDEPSWTWLSRIEFNYGYHIKFINHLGFNEISAYGLKYECFGRFLNFYSRKLKLQLQVHHLVPYTKSFVSLKALGEKNARKLG